MTAMTTERPIFENAEWLVSESGLEHKRTGYFIDRESLGQRREDGLWSWPLHMAEKNWCGMPSFAEAFTCAASLYGFAADAELAQSLQVARCEVSAWPQAAKAAPSPVPAIPRRLHPQASMPISAGWRYAGKSLSGQDFQGADETWRLRPEKGARPFLKNLRKRSEHLNPARDMTASWQAPHRIRTTGTRLVRLLQAAWNIR